MSERNRENYDDQMYSHSRSEQIRPGDRRQQEQARPGELRQGDLRQSNMRQEPWRGDVRQGDMRQEPWQEDPRQQSWQEDPRREPWQEDSRQPWQEDLRQETWQEDPLPRESRQREARPGREPYSMPPQRSASGAKAPGLPKKKMKKSKMVAFVMFILLWLCVTAGVGYWWFFLRDAAIKPVTTFPTKDVALVTGAEGLSDPVYQSLWSGIERIGQKNGMTTGYVTVKANTEKEWTAALDTACKDYHIVVCYGQDLADNLDVSAQKYPHIKFIFVEGMIFQNEGEESTHPNVVEVSFRVEEASYLAGYLAAKSFNGGFGFIGGKADKDTRAFYGFAMGTMAVDSYREVLQGLPGSSSNTNRAKDLADNLCKNGAQVIYHSMSSKDEKLILDTAKAADKKIISCSPVASQDSAVFATVLKHYDVVMEDLLSRVNQLPMGQRMTFGFEEEALDLTRPGSDVSDTLWKQVQDLKDKIINGQFTAPGTKDEYDAKVML